MHANVLGVNEQCRKYWSDEFRFVQVADVMTLNQFEDLKHFLHFNDNTTGTGGEDKLHKIWPLISMLKERYNSVPKEENLSIDEQIVPFKGRSTVR